MNRLSCYLSSAAILLCALAAPAVRAASPASAATCHGRQLLVEAVSDTNWNDMFPVVIGGTIDVPAEPQPPIIREPPVCVCPRPPYGQPTPGVGVTYWAPEYLAEVTRSPGCLVGLGGQDVLGGAFANQTGGQRGGASGIGAASGSLLQAHWYIYPLFQMISASINSMCFNSTSPFSLAAMTELDPTWHNDLWAAILAPESSLFANPVMQSACLVDAASTAVAFPIDALFWCAGSWADGIYPFSGNTNSQQSDQQANMLLLTKFLALQARVGLILDTVGPQAICFAVPNPILLKSQFRVDPLYPLPQYGAPIYIGQTEMRWGDIPPANFPMNQDSVYLMWIAHQCCFM